MRVLVTGSNGFIGKNLIVRLRELSDFEITNFDRNDDEESLQEIVKDVDAVIHLAGENRPTDISEFQRVNVGLTKRLCDALAAHGKQVKLIFASSIQVAQQAPYGESKIQAEELIREYSETTGSSVAVFQLPGVFGKWCKPNYNSVVATFCHNIANDIPIQVHDASAKLRLVYIDDVVDEFIRQLYSHENENSSAELRPEYTTTVGGLAEQIESFKEIRNSLLVGRVGSGLERALYATYMSYLPFEQISYDLTRHADERGVFVEMIKTADSGQFSYFTSHPGVTRGEHYHHSKTEKFLVIRGAAQFRFRHILTDETYEILTSGIEPKIVESVPGWAHDITNIGDDEMLVLLWSNENFDRNRPDTIAHKV